MVANVAFSALNLLALQAGTWDLRSMWGTHEHHRQGGGVYSVYFVRMVAGRDD